MTTPAPDAVGDLDCSARGCRQDATWGVLWNNPRIHTPERRKVWLACDDHREHLEEYLRVRDFLRDTVPVDVLPRLDLGGRPSNPMAGTWGRPAVGTDPVADPGTR